MNKKGENFVHELVFRQKTEQALAMTKILQVFGIGNQLYFLKEKELKRLLILSFGIWRARTVNMSLVNEAVALEESGRSSLDSQYNYLLKTFQTWNVEGCVRQIFNILVILFYSGEEEIKILIDRTNWDVGERRVNILSVGLLYRNQVFIPLIGEDLGYKGNSDSETRIKLIDRFVEWWKEMEVPVPQFVIVGDREFIGEKWLANLGRKGIEYVIRLRSNLKFETWLNDNYKIGKKFKVKVLHRYMSRYDKLGVEVVLEGETIAWVHAIKNEGKQADKEPYLYLITNKEELDSTGEIYRSRWKIETCFSYLKSKGLNLEQLNLEGTHKTDILMAVLSLVYAIVVHEGEQAQEEKPPKKITYANGSTYPRVSVFKEGRRRLVRIISFAQFLEYMEKLFIKIYEKWTRLKKIHILNLSG